MTYSFKVNGFSVKHPYVGHSTLAMKWSEMKLLSCVWLFGTPWTVAYKTPQSMEFSRQEYWSELPFLSPGDLPYPGTEPRSPSLQAGALPSEPPGKPSLAIINYKYILWIYIFGYFTVLLIQQCKENYSLPWGLPYSLSSSCILLPVPQTSRDKAACSLWPGVHLVPPAVSTLGCPGLAPVSHKPLLWPPL